MSVLAFPRYLPDRGTVHVMPCNEGGFHVSHESASGSSWGGLEGPYQLAEEAVAAAYAMARECYGGCNVDVWPIVLAELQTGSGLAGYLRSRAITMTLPETLRFARLRYPQEQARRPALVAAVCAPNGDLTGIQRTFLTEAGAKADVPEVKLSLGRVAGGAIQLGPPVASLVVTEGLEDGLTLAQALGRSVWVSAGTAMLPRMELAEITRAVVIGADGDGPGEQAATKAAHAFAAAGRKVRIMRPAAGCKDFNAELMGKRS